MHLNFRNKTLQRIILLLVFALSSTVLQAQIRISGKVTDAATGEALPFVSIYIKNSTLGTSSDLNGAFNIRLSTAPDSLTASFVGYTSKTLPVAKGVAAQELIFKLEPSSHALQEIVIRPGENPAFKIMREVINHKNANDKRKLTAYQYEAYTKMQLHLNGLGQKKGKDAVTGAVTRFVDTDKLQKGEKGDKQLPFFMSETLSDFSYNRDPKLQKEVIKATKVTGIGLQDGSLMSQLMGSSYQDYNFYQNRVSVLQKDFISPIADGWKRAYDYELEDSLFIGDEWCYQIKVNQKRPQDLAFNGTIWITEKTYALRKIDVEISRSANINFVDGIRLVQELQPVNDIAWIPNRTDVTIQLQGLNRSKTGIKAHVYTSYKDVVVNQPHANRYFDKPVELLQEATKQQDTFWQSSRHDTLSLADRQVYATIDSIRETPKIKRFTTIMTLLSTGYQEMGKFSWGPWPYTYAWNNFEGHRFQLGGKTNIDFSNKLELRGYAAYGTDDKKLKYSTSARFILSRDHWSEVGVTHKQDLQQVGLMSERLEASPFFMGFSRFGTLRRPILVTENSAYLQRDVLRGVTQRIAFSNRVFAPQYNFAYVAQQGDQPVLKDGFTTTEVSFTTRIASHQVYVQNDNERISLGNGNRPVFTLKYTAGLPNIMRSTLDYQRVDVNVTHDFPMGFLGNANYKLDAGKIFSAVPYPLLEVHTGNETPFYYTAAFNLLNNFEFASDTYASLHYEQYFEGLFFNRLPLIRKLKWRTLATANILYGDLSTKNQQMLSPVGIDGAPQEQFYTFGGGKPYMEVGYGIENIFKVLRVDAFHRLSYLDNKDARKFGLKFSVQFKL